MMNNRAIGKASLTVIAAAAVFAIFFWSGARHSSFVPEPREESEGREGDPGDQDQFEWLRLHDPATGIIPERMRARELSYARTLPVREQWQELSGAKTWAEAGSTLSGWTQRGPQNIGGRTRALAVDVSNTSVILAGGVSGGMWRSSDGGSSWTMATALSQLLSVTCVAQDVRSGHTATWYYGTGEYRGNSASGGGASYQGDGLFKSTDDGMSWFSLASTSSGAPQSFNAMFDFVWDIAVDRSATTSDILYAATTGGIKRSTDGGASWSTVLGSLTDSRYTDVAITSAGVLYATMSSSSTTGGTAQSAGIWRSPDGTTWTKISPAGWPSSFNRIVLAVAPSNESVVYFMGDTPGAGKTTIFSGAAENNSFWKYTYASGDGSGAGGAWEDRSANLPGFGGLIGSFNSYSSYNLVVKVKPDDANTIFFAGSNLYRSTTALADSTHTSWIGGYAPVNDYSNYPNHHPDQHSLCFDPANPSVLYSGHDGGLSKTLDDLATAPSSSVPSVSWISLNNGYVTAQFYTVAIDHSTPGNAIVIGGTQDNGTLFTSHTSTIFPWASLWSGDGGFCAFSSGRSSYYASSQNGEIYRLIVSEVTGQATNGTRVDPTGGTGYLFINPFVLDPVDNEIMYLAGGSSLWMNDSLTDIPLGSNNTTSLHWTNLSAAGIAGATITALGASTASPAHRLYYGSSNGKVYRLDGASTATAASAPVDIGTGKGLPTGAYVNCIAVDPSNGDRALLVFSNYNVQSVFLTTDGGTGWSAVSGNLEQNPDGSGDGPSVRWAAVLPGGAQALWFVGTSTGLYSTQTLNGSSTVWTLEGSTTIGNAVVDMVDVRTSDGLVVAATHGHGLFSATASVSSVPQEPVPQQTALLQNYPNPFNPSTVISYRLASSAYVTVKLFDIQGREIETLVHENQDAGTHSVVWTPRGLATGAYICRLEAGGTVQSRKILLLR